MKTRLLMRQWFALPLALAIAVVAACGGGGDAPPVAAGAAVGAAGGTVDGPNGSQAIVPANALAQPVAIAIAQTDVGAPALPAGNVNVSAMFALTPHGTSFAVPVTIRIPFDPGLLGAGETPALWKTNAAQNGWEEVAGVTVVGTMVQAQISSFSFVVARPALVRPRIDVEPQSKEVVEPTAWGFSVGAFSSVNSGFPSFQWKRNGVPITGANGTTYNTGATSVGNDNGAVYSVEVTNLAGTTQSTNATLTVTLTAPTTAALTVTITPAGSGTVTSAPAGIDCGADCTETYAFNTVVSLTATPAPGFTFSGWSANCNAGAVTMNAVQACTATFAASTALNLTGTWIVDYNCTGAGGVFSGRDTLTVTQTETRVDFTSQPDGGTFTGTLAAMTMTYAGGGPGYTESGVWTMQGTGNFTKTSNYINLGTDLGGSCPGTGQRQ